METRKLSFDRTVPLVISFFVPAVKPCQGMVGRRAMRETGDVAPCVPSSTPPAPRLTCKLPPSHAHLRARALLLSLYPHDVLLSANILPCFSRSARLRLRQI